MKKFKTLNYFAAAALVSILLLVIYASVQQVYRTSLNDPQLQMVRDIKIKLEEGKSFANLVSTDTIDITKSLSPFFVLYDAEGKATSSNAFLDRKFPQVPVDLFENAKKKGEHTVTWQPRAGVRMAMVIEKVNTSPLQFIAAGRSMVEVEKRTEQLRNMIIIAWIICTGIIVLVMLINYFGTTNNILQKSS